MVQGRKPAAELTKVAPLFAALGEATRLHIVARLCNGGPLSTTRLTKGTRVTRQAVTKHLRALEGAGLVHGVRSGRERIWELRVERLSEIHRYLDQIAREWDQTLERLRVFVESERDG